MLCFISDLLLRNFQRRPHCHRTQKILSSTARILAILTFSAFLCSCAGDRRHTILISVPEQRMALLRDGKPIAFYPVSTSKFGLGSEPGSYRTPTGEFRVRKKIGDNLPPGAVLKSRIPTGEILPPNAPGRDPIVSRILWLDGLEPHNRNAFERFIYIHGTPEERTLGTPASYGCIRMSSRDVIHLYENVGTGARVRILNAPLPVPSRPPATAPAHPPAHSGARLSFCSPSQPS